MKPVSLISIIVWLVMPLGGGAALANHKGTPHGQHTAGGGLEVIGCADSSCVAGAPYILGDAVAYRPAISSVSTASGDFDPAVAIVLIPLDDYGLPGEQLPVRVGAMTLEGPLQLDAEELVFFAGAGCTGISAISADSLKQAELFASPPGITATTEFTGNATVELIEFTVVKFDALSRRFNGIHCADFGGPVEVDVLDMTVLDENISGFGNATYPGPFEVHPK